jgi:hypothetical protein
LLLLATNRTHILNPKSFWLIFTIQKIFWHHPNKKRKRKKKKKNVAKLVLNNPNQVEQYA